LISAGTILYQILLILGGGSSQDFMHNLAFVLGPAITAAVLLVYHVRILTGDQHAFAALPPEDRAQPANVDVYAAASAASAVLLVSSADPHGLNALVEEMRRRLPAGAQLNAFSAPDLLPGELGSWLASRIQPDNGPDVIPDA
ncbi:MAG TPA: hypothetical protein VLQ48_11475, partial [Chloroflexia bacterium]|nr:hypothetical protein [Chloroflexia bacterium]